MPTIALLATAERRAEAESLANGLRVHLTDDRHAEDFDFLLELTPTHLQLRQTGRDAPGPLYVDFAGGALAYRRRRGGGRNQPLGRAVGLKPGYNPRILDATAGLGRDAFILASLGCQVHLLERSPVVAALLRDGLRRALLDPEAGAIVSARMTLTVADTLDYLENLSAAEQPDVIYLDPMYPEREKSALVKKEMRLFRAIVGEDLDTPALLALSLMRARKRVVVKRARHAPPIEGPTRSLLIDGSSTRFDVYLTG